jgi:hypothetical protein
LNKICISAILLVITSVVMGCAPSPTPSPVPSPTALPTPSPSPSPTTPEAGEFSIYLLAGEVPTSELSTVDLRDLDLQDEPIVSETDIIAYTWDTHEIELTAEAYERIRDLFVLPVRVQGMPFVVSVGSEPVYAGAFMTPASSISFDGVVICQPFDVDRHVIRIVLGYPSPEAFTGKDPRSDPRILQSLDAAVKLN